MTGNEREIIPIAVTVDRLQILKHTSNMVAVNFCFANTETDDDVLTILAMKEKPIQPAGATVLPVKSASEFAVATIIGYLDFWGHQEVMIKCDQEQSMKRIAELLQERRRPRRTIVEHSPNGNHQSNEVVENARHAPDLTEKTGVNVIVKSLLAPLVGETLRVDLDNVCHWCGRTNNFQASKWQRPRWRNGMLWRSHLLPNPASNPNQKGTKVGGRRRVLG